MIKINLLPAELRPVKKKKIVKRAASAKPAGEFNAQQLPLKAASIAIAGIFAAVTLFFYVDYLRLNKKQAKVAQAFAEIQPRVQEVRLLEQELTTLLHPEKDFLNAHVLNKAAITSILQEMSVSLPEGLWLTSLTINNSGKQRSFQVQGLALNSQDKTNIQQIEEYLHQIKRVLPNAHFTYSTGKQLAEKVAATAFTANFEWQAA